MEGRAQSSSRSSAGAAGSEATAAAAAAGNDGSPWGPEVYVHPEAEITGRVVFGAGCCICAAAKIRGGEGGIEFGACCVIREMSCITNRQPSKMSIGSFCVFDVSSCVEDMETVGDFVRVGSRAHVSGCKSLGIGSRVAAHCELLRGAEPLGPQEFLFGVARRCTDSSNISTQAQLLAFDLPFLQRQLRAPPA